MVLEVRLRDSVYYACGECGLIYTDPATAGRCEEWCGRYKSCNRELAAKAVGYVRRYSRSLRLS